MVGLAASTALTFSSTGSNVSAFDLPMVARIEFLTASGTGSSASCSFEFSLLLVARLRESSALFLHYRVVNALHF